MDSIILSGTVAFLITFFAIPVIIQVAREKKLYDEPGERKVHKMVIPTLGGLGIFAGFILATLLFTPAIHGASKELQYFAAAALVIFFLGIKDDILILSAAKKFIGQLVATAIVIKFGGVHLYNMHGFLGIHEIPRLASVALTAFTILVITNSFNLIDGVDGLAGCLGLLTSLVFGTYFYSLGPTYLIYAVMAFSLAGSLIGFLIYNFSPAKIFMGDTGSLLIGLTNSILVIKFINLSSNPLVKFPLEAGPAIGFAILIVPLFDTLRVFGLRILGRRSPFSPDRTHVHHFLLDLGFNHRKVTVICVLVNIALIAMAFFMRGLGTTVVIGALLIASFVFVAIIYFNRPKKIAVDEAKPHKGKIFKSHKIFTLATKALETEQ